ncbi:hypothetical protein PMAYCL1PPCAC_01642, partial [Pristionchus mayeri]
MEEEKAAAAPAAMTIQDRAVVKANQNHTTAKSDQASLPAKANQYRAAPGITQNTHSRMPTMQLFKGTGRLGARSNSLTSDHFAKAFLEIYELYRAGKQELTESLINHFATIRIQFTKLSMFQKELVFVELVRQIEEKPYLFCSFCDRFMFTARQTFMHTFNPEHIHKTNRNSGDFVMVNYLMRIIVGEWRGERLIREEREKVRSQKDKWSCMSLDDPDLFPGGDPTQQLFGFDEFMEMCKNTPRAEIADMWIEELEKRSRNLMQRLNEGIDDSKVLCISCSMIFGDAAEYYTHLLTFFHLNNAETFDHDTLVVNVEKRHMARLQPWPKEPLPR